MKSTALWAGVIIILAIAAYFLYANSHANVAPGAQATATSTDFTPVQSSIGTFSYTCDNGDAMTMTPADDMSRISIGPNGAQSKFTDATLDKVAASSGARYEGQGIVFVVHGETVKLTTNGSTITCSPLQNPDVPPFNFGD